MSGVYDVRTPFNGTFYRRDASAGEPFVEVGSTVAEGDTVCIVEAMKLFNPVAAEFSGTVVEICVENEHQVEFGDLLVKIKQA